MSNEKRGSFTGSIGFVLAAAGSSVGLGNLWRFPYLAAKNGGGVFLLVYIILALTFGFALMTTEIAIGRKTKRSPIKAYGDLKKGFGFLGYLSSIVPFIIFPYYCVIGGWVTKYTIDYLDGRGFELVNPDNVDVEALSVDAKSAYDSVKDKVDGYNEDIAYLYEEIGKILGLYQEHNLVLIGAGNLGQALANYVNFEKRGFLIRGIFDSNEELWGKEVRGIPVNSMEKLEAFVRENDIDIAVLTIPKTSAEEVAERLVQCGIKAIWNFAHVDLKVPEFIQVENVHLSDSLMKLSYNINRYNNEKQIKE